MTEITSKLSTALADRYVVERELGADRMTMHYYGRPLQAMLAVTLLTAVFPVHLLAQCADGTPPPCAVAVGRPAIVARDEPPAQDVRARSFLVLPFRNLTRTPELEWLIDGSVALFTDALGQWQELSVVPETRLYPAMRRHGLTSGEVMDEEVVRRMAAETGGWTVVTGDVLETGGRVRVRARAYDVVTNQELARTVEEADVEEDIRAVFERVAFGLLGTEDLARRPDLIRASATTQSLDAYKAYLRARAHYDRLEVDAALEAAREAVRLDSAFALAHAWVTMAWMGKIGIFGDPDPQAAAAIFDPRSELNRAMRRAVTLSSRLPPRERQFVQAIDAVLRADFPAARRALESTINVDSTDTEALGMLAGVELFDPVLVTVNGVERLRGSVNAALRLVKRVSVLDAARLDVYVMLAQSYREAGGYWTGWTWLMGMRNEPASLIDWVTSLSRADRQFVPVLRDTMELIPVDPVDSLKMISEDVLLAARARARVVARAWVDKWLTAAPTDPRAHSLASSVYELDGDFNGALSALIRAESLGGTRPTGLGARRMVLLGKLRRHAEAFNLLDSLWRGGRIQEGPLILLGFPRDGFVARSWAVGLFLEYGDLDRADSAYGLLESILRTRVSEDDVAAVAAAALTGALSRPSWQWWAFSAAELPQTLLLSALDTLLLNINRAPPDGRLANAIPQLLQGAAETADTTGRLPLAGHAMDAALVLANLDREDLAFELASFAVRIDPGLRTRVADAPWYKRRTREPD